MATLHALNLHPTIIPWVFDPVPRNRLRTKLDDLPPFLASGRVPDSPGGLPRGHAHQWKLLTGSLAARDQSLPQAWKANRLYHSDLSHLRLNSIR